MYCMKCGREVEDEQVFCVDCLADMEKYPVAPGTVVKLPSRNAPPASRKQTPRRRKLTPSEQIPILKNRIRKLTIALVVTVLLFLATLYPAVNFFLRHYDIRPGQNYTAVTIVDPAHPKTAGTD